MYRVTLEPWSDDEPTVAYYPSADDAYRALAPRTLVGWKAVRIDPITIPKEEPPMPTPTEPPVPPMSDATTITDEGLCPNCGGDDLEVDPPYVECCTCGWQGRA